MSSGPLADALLSLGEAAQARGLPHLVVGGNALIYHGVPRFTRDIDYLVPIESRSLWHHFLLERGYRRFHESGSFSQYEPDEARGDSSSRQQILVPVDLMCVDVDTWQKLLAAAQTESLSDNYVVHWPSVFHLIALKLHAWRSPFRASREQDWSDILGLISQNEIVVTESNFRELVYRYGGREAVELLELP